MNTAAESELTIVERRSGWGFLDLAELWRFRGLLYFLTWRDVKVRYKQTVLGAAWALLQPLATMVAFSLFFGRVAAQPSAAVPYPMFVLAGLLPWAFFSSAVSSAGLSIIGSQGLVTKVYFPRFVIPMGAVASALVDFAISFLLLLAMLAYYGMPPRVEWLMLPVVLLGLVLLAMAIGTLLAALTVEYRDFRHVVPFMMQIWMFMTPAIYLQSDLGLGSRTQTLAMLNPMTGLVANFRVALLGGGFDFTSLAFSFLVGIVVLVGASLHFRRVERRFADII